MFAPSRSNVNMRESDTTMRKRKTSRYKRGIMDARISDPVLAFEIMFFLCYNCACLLINTAGKHPDKSWFGETGGL